MLQRFRAAIAAGQRAAAPKPAEAPTPTRTTEKQRLSASWALIHFGDAGAIEAKLAEHLSHCRRFGLGCLLVSDDIPLHCVRSRDILFEFAPWPARTALTVPGGYAGSLDHSFRRLDQIMRFWQAVGCTWEGDRARDLSDQVPDWVHAALKAGQADKGTASQRMENMLVSPRF